MEKKDSNEDDEENHKCGNIAMHVHDNVADSIKIRIQYHNKRC